MSDINYLSINENFPVAGQDNDTQVFRDNFNTIKNSLRISKEEITDLEDNTARLDQANDYNSNVTQNTVFLNTSIQTIQHDLDDASAPYELDFTSAGYHSVTLSSDRTIQFSNFPGEAGAADTVNSGTGRITVEFNTSNQGDSWEVSFISSSGIVIKKDADFPSTFTVNSRQNPIIIDVWKRSGENTLYMKYVGQFSE